MREIMATKKIYLVDTENVGSTWKELLPAKANADQILLFFTDNSPYVSYNDLQLILQYPNQFEMIKCNPGKNGLDFQLVSYLGYLLKTASKSNYIIVSNDCGFDAVVKFWQDRGMSVIRSNVYHVLQPDAEVQQKTQASFAQAETVKGKRGRYPFNEKRNSQNARRVHTSNQTVKAEKFAVGNSSEIAANSQSERKISADQPDSNFQKSSQISGQQTNQRLYTGSKASEQQNNESPTGNTASENMTIVEVPEDNTAFPDTQVSESPDNTVLENAKTDRAFDSVISENIAIDEPQNSTAPEKSPNNQAPNASIASLPENIQVNHRQQLLDTSLSTGGKPENENLFEENNSFDTLQESASFAEALAANAAPANDIQENRSANDPTTADVLPQAVSKKTAKRGRPKGSRKTNKTFESETALPEASGAIFEQENIILDFSNLTVSEKAALLRKYLPDDFSENQESLDIISDIMFGHDTTNHHQLHLAFVKNFGDEKGTLIYKAFRPHLAEFRA